MILKEFPPGLATRGTIRAYRVVHFVAASVNEPAVKFFPPTPEQCLQIFVHQPEIAEYPDGRRVQWRCALVGSQQMMVRRHIPASFLMIQVVFEQGALFQLTGISGDGLQNAYVDAEAVLGISVRALREELGELSTYESMIASVDVYIARLHAGRSGGARAVTPALRWLRDSPGASIDRAADQCSLSLRQFERACRQHTGLAPRELASLARFDRAFHTRLQRPDLDWLSIAIACGYYDYQHMARDFRLFAGMTPPRLLETQRSSPERQLGIRQQFDLSYRLPFGRQ